MLTPEERRQAEELFEALLHLPPAERSDFIADECGDNAPLASEVWQLLAHYEAAPADFLQSPVVDQDPSHSSETIGAYELKDVLGEGAMGVVYRAEQRSPVTRVVALKILKLGMDSREILARFEAERQTLARLEHPNIARVYDAGSTADGRPYFVMEYVPGQAITSYCDAHRLRPRERVELFIGLCRGVQHAHQKGVIHRDLKPMNILVAEHDGEAHPKVIDFGVARAVEPDLTGATLFTRHGQLIGTPEYMSPEQAEAAPVDTRTDVYSLGAVLYELLVGVLPLDPTTLRQAGFGEMMRLIREEDPIRPSIRASTLDRATTTAAHCRNVEPRVLAHSLRGDLDWIVLKALENDPDRRYPTVAEFAADLQRHLDDQTVTARPASAWYTMTKFTRRHRVGVGFAFTILGVVLLLAASMAVQAKRVVRERDRANHEAEVARQVKDFLVDIFLVSNPTESRGRDVSALEILDRGAKRIVEIEDDAVRAELTGTLGAVYQNLGIYDRSDSLFIAAKDIWLQTEGGDHPGTLLALSDVAGVYKALGRLAEAESLYTTALEGWARLDLSQDRRSLDTTSRLANVYRQQGRYAQAESLYLHTSSALRELGGEDDADVLRIRGNLAFCYSVQGRYEDAAAILEDVLQRQRRLFGDDAPQTLSTMSRLGGIYSRVGRYAESEVLLVEAHRGKERVFGRTHPEYLTSVEELGALYLERGDPQRAKPLFEEVLAARRRILGDSHPSTAVAMHNMASVLTEVKEYVQAESLTRETLQLRMRTRGEDHLYTQQTRIMLAVLLARRGALDEALENLRVVVDHGYAHPYLLNEDVLKVLSPLQGRAEFDSLVVTVRRRLASSD